MHSLTDWVSHLLAVLQSFDPDLTVREVSGGLLPAPRHQADSTLDFSTAMEKLAERYIDSVADSAPDTNGRSSTSLE